MQVYAPSFMEHPMRCSVRPGHWVLQRPGQRPFRFYEEIPMPPGAFQKAKVIQM
jgi:hypothetical protein